MSRGRKQRDQTRQQALRENRRNRPRAKLTKHAVSRSIERKLDPEVVSCVADAVRDLLNDTAIKIKHNGHTVVAARDQKTGEVSVLTAWRN